MKTIFCTLLLAFASLVASAQEQASLTIENHSQRYMTIKVMRTENGVSSLHETITISAHSSSTVYFAESGYYFTKTKAVLNRKDPVYQKGKPFLVTNDETGYSTMTLTFSIKESNVPQVAGGKQISKAEFDKN
jgi:hypothetical protein